MTARVSNAAVLDKCALAYLLTLCAGDKASRISIAVREIIFAKLREDQKNTS